MVIHVEVVCKALGYMWPQSSCFPRLWERVVGEERWPRGGVDQTLQGLFQTRTYLLTLVCVYTHIDTYSYHIRNALKVEAKGDHLSISTPFFYHIQGSLLFFDPSPTLLCTGMAI